MRGKYDDPEALAEEQTDGEGGEEGQSGSGGEGSAWQIPRDDVFNLPSFYELNQLSKDEQIVRELAEQSLFENRMSVRAKGYEVTALTKVQQYLNRERATHKQAAGHRGGGPDLAEHPELAHMGGQADPNHIKLPESEELANQGANNDPKLQHKLQQKIAARFGMGGIGSLSKQALEAEYKKKMRARIKEAPTEKPRFGPQSAPTFKPN